MIHICNISVAIEAIVLPAKWLLAKKLFPSIMLHRAEDMLPSLNSLKKSGLIGPKLVHICPKLAQNWSRIVESGPGLYEVKSQFTQKMKLDQMVIKSAPYYFYYVNLVHFLAFFFSVSVICKRKICCSFWDNCEKNRDKIRILENVSDTLTFELRIKKVERKLRKSLGL